MHAFGNYCACIAQGVLTSFTSDVHLIPGVLEMYIGADCRAEDAEERAEAQRRDAAGLRQQIGSLKDRLSDVQKRSGEVHPDLEPYCGSLTWYHEPAMKMMT